MRIISAGLIFWAIAQGYFVGALALFIFAGLTDWIDGRLARYMQQKSTFGALFDPLADKILMTATLMALWMHHQAPRWFVGIVIGRDVMILCGFAVLRLAGRAEKSEFAPSKLGKHSTGWQIAAIAFLLFFAMFPSTPLLGSLCLGIMFVSVGYTGASAGDYLAHGITLFRRPHLSLIGHRIE